MSGVARMSKAISGTRLAQCRWSQRDNRSRISRPRRPLIRATLAVNVSNASNAPHAVGGAMFLAPQVCQDAKSEGGRERRRIAMRCKLHYSVVAIALVAAFGSSAAQAQFRLKNAAGATNTTNMRPWTTTHAGSNRPAQPGKYVFTTTPDPTSAKGYVGRNDGYVQQSTQGGPRQSLQGRTTKKGSDAIRSTPAVQLNRFSNTQAKPQGQVRSQMMFTVGHINGH